MARIAAQTVKAKLTGVSFHSQFVEPCFNSVKGVGRLRQRWFVVWEVAAEYEKNKKYKNESVI